MYFFKISHPYNFVFADRFDARSSRYRIGKKTFQTKLDDLGQSVFRLRVNSKTWQDYSLAGLTPTVSRPGKNDYAMAIDAKGTLRITDPRGGECFSGLPGACFGVCGSSWILQFKYDPAYRFYGMGEKNNGFEKSGLKTKFWTTDVVADFARDLVANGVTDPMYVSIPYLIVKHGNRYLGILIDNPYPSFMATNPRIKVSNQQDLGASSNFYLGASDGTPVVYFVVGPTLAQLTEKLQTLVGRTPLPPRWALGHHQCRWGYQSYRDLDELDRKFRRHRIPCDGLWLDIEYMDGYRVFTFDQKNFPRPAQQIAQLTRRGRKIVPIIDPGVKWEKGYPVHDDGIRQDVFCKTRENKNFVGFVWPGATLFPDFTTAKGARWWARQVATFFQSGIAGAWLDMNDPAVGPVEMDDMRFNDGKIGHEAHHNQYGLGMAMASRQGVLQANPGQRPFLLTRSAATGVAKHAAVWTGDNTSNYWHLKNAIPVTLNLALSGVPFNGPDVPGFIGNADARIAIDWYKAGFLFPFFRNHSENACARQEPWVWGSKTMAIIRHYIRLRYKLLPYLYNLFIDQEESGAAIMRPLLYEFEDTAAQPLDRIADQYMLGRAILHAPFLERDAKTRAVVLPKTHWFDLAAGKWVAGGKTVHAAKTDPATPLYLRDGSIVPMLVGTPTDQQVDLGDLEFHLFLSPTFKGTASYRYRFDDGETFQYLQGERTGFTLHAQRQGDGIAVTVDAVAAGYRPCKLRLVVYDSVRAVTCAIGGRVDRARLKPGQWTAAGKPIAFRQTAVYTVGT